MKWLWRRIKSIFSKPVKPIYQEPSLPPETDIEWDHGEIEFQRLPELPISKGRKAKIQAIVVHFTAGWQNQKARDAIAFMQKNGHGYLFIDHKGSVWQHINLDQAYAHAGKSIMPSFSRMAGKSNVSSFSIGIEVACGGQLNKENKTWFGKAVSEENSRTATRAIHGVSGKFEAFTQEQEASLIDAIVKLCKMHSIHPSNIVGHHEVSPSRKDDPGASLSMGMHKLRAIVSDKLSEQK